ncbi:penicillin-binding protein 1A [Luteimonas sp. MC1825]|uniref:penicillin-binding protein 1A n=1 Tax=Luteimonas sp. MC1825 TaxID=2761107 RepID=UPI00160C4C84|nr:penicillin-binding protein 1A [Luteimonas sp. MC1825]MBB6600090.1 penicillin-binding protein 1A [Luteimonas sp. MC1825]QOC87790.1 penicillin-binding protein 1A [Luteimonas sp. MC1825]
MPRFRRLLRWLLILFAGFFVIGLLAAGTLYYVVSSRLPDVESLRNVELQEPLYVYARDGRLMALFGETRRYPVDIAEVPERLKQAFIAIEDNRFYEHHGVDYRGVSRAIWLLATTDDKRVPGGSTITQQVARQFFLSSEYSYTRKLSEMLLAMKMERELSKDEIFELYLNKSFFGNRAYGIAAAAEFYYGKKLDQLDLDELATLAAIPKFPSSGNPVTNPERARIRRDYVLQRMHELGFISLAEATAAQAVAMHATPHERPVEVYAPYVAEMVRQEMIARYGGDVLTRGYHVTTTIDPTMQLAADVAVRSGLSAYDHRHGWSKIEQAFDLAADEDAATAGARLRGIPAQSGLLPAIVLRAGDGTADVALTDGTTVTLDAASSRWTGRNPGALLKRGDVTRVRRIEPKGKDGAAPDPAAKPTWQLDQVPRAQSTLVSLEPDNGALRALVGGFSFAGQKFNRATQARRQPGSSFKPFIYAAAFERGFNPASVVVDAPVVFRMRRGQDWRPQNDDGKFAGPMRLREALVRSRNLVSVRLLDAIGVDYARRYISHMGFDESELPPNLSIALGTPSLTPLDITRGYAVFANGGFRVTPWFIDEVKDRDGKVVFKENPAVACRSCGADGTTVATANVVDGFNLGPSQPATAAAPAATTPEPAAPVAGPDRLVAPRAIDARVAYQLVSMMRDVVQRGTGTAAKVLGREDVGGKTGSTNDHRDAWFSGFGGNLATVVWVGRDDNRSLGYREYGGKSALPIWIDFMRVALDGMPIAANEPPDGMVKVAVSASGRLLPTTSDGGLVEWVKAEDLERMESTYEDVADEVPTEEAFDIF